MCQNTWKCLSDVGFGVVPGGRIEPSTHGFSALEYDSVDHSNIKRSRVPLGRKVGLSWLRLAASELLQAQFRALHKGARGRLA
jgi:hypothetical protein